MAHSIMECENVPCEVLDNNETDIVGEKTSIDKAHIITKTVERNDSLLPRNQEVSCNGYHGNDSSVAYGNYTQQSDDSNKVKLHSNQAISKTNQSNAENEFSIQLEGLEKIILQQRSEIERLQQTMRQENELSQKQLQQFKSESDLKIEKLIKQCEQASKEREAMVMKYAVSENSAINLQRHIKQLEGKLKDLKKEKDSMESKIGIVVGEKVKLSQTIDLKNTEIQGLEREVQKKKDELHSQSSNLKFFQNKLKLELETHKETQNKLEKLHQKYKEAKEETEQVRKDGQAMLMRYETEGRKVLEFQDSVELINLQEEMEVCRQKNKDLAEKNNQLCQKVQVLETERLEYEENLSQLKKIVDNDQQIGVDLHAAKAELDSLNILLQREKERYQASQVEVERTRQCNIELLQEMEKCREREAELLDFTQMLTEKNVVLQSELTTLETRAQQQESDLAVVKRQINDFTIECTSLREELETEKRQRAEEKELLTRHLEEKTKMAEKLSKQLEDEIGECQLIKKKHAASIKELTREVQACRRRGETLETPLGQGSRASSNTSLNTAETVSPTPSERVSQAAEPDKQVLIEKIVKVQRSNARKQEKLEFLEEHSRQLTIELQKKSRIIQSLVLKHQPGALVSDIMDDNKMALAKHGGIMASVYSSKPSDDAMTLELSLEINKKLQAVLEDTLLKNITLKENMETLGNEIARLATSEKVKSVKPTTTS